jgi:TIR domain
MGVVFVNYRAKDNPLGAAGIHDVLVRRFGGDRVFRDSVSMAAGEHYPTKLREALEQADVLVAVIGPRWNELADEQGQLLIQRDRDWGALGDRSGDRTRHSHCPGCTPGYARGLYAAQPGDPAGELTCPAFSGQHSCG